MVNNAGIMPKSATVREESLEAAKEVMAVNYFAPFILAREAIPFLEKVKGNIVFTSSSLSRSDNPTGLF